PTIQSDKDDYPPGGRVTLTGANWQPGEVVHIYVNNDTGSSWSRIVDVVADETGHITDAFNLPDWFVAEYSVKSTGPISGTANWMFTDGNVQFLSNDPTLTGVVWERYGANDCSGSVLGNQTGTGNITSNAATSL